MVYDAKLRHDDARGVQWAHSGTVVGDVASLCERAAEQAMDAMVSLLIVLPLSCDSACSVFAHAPRHISSWVYTGAVRAQLTTAAPAPRSSPPSSAPSRDKSAAARGHRSGLRSVAQEFDWEFDLIRQAPSFLKTQNRPASDVTFGPTTPKRAALRLKRFAQVKTVPPS